MAGCDYDFLYVNTFKIHSPRSWRFELQRSRKKVTTPVTVTELKQISFQPTKISSPHKPRKRNKRRASTQLKSLLSAGRLVFRQHSEPASLTSETVSRRSRLSHNAATHAIVGPKRFFAVCLSHPSYASGSKHGFGVAIEPLRTMSPYSL